MENKITKKLQKSIKDYWRGNISKTEICKKLKSNSITNKDYIISIMYLYKPIYKNKNSYFSLDRNLDEAPTQQQQQEPQNLISLVKWLKQFVGTPYEKILIEGNLHIWFASPVYRHNDYNKSIWRKNTPFNRMLAKIINSLIHK